MAIINQSAINNVSKGTQNVKPAMKRGKQTKRAKRKPYGKFKKPKKKVSKVSDSNVSADQSIPEKGNLIYKQGCLQSQGKQYIIRPSRDDSGMAVIYDKGTADLLSDSNKLQQWSSRQLIKELPKKNIDLSNENTRSVLPDARKNREWDIPSVVNYITNVRHKEDFIDPATRNPFVAPVSVEPTGKHKSMKRGSRASRASKEQTAGSMTSLHSKGSVRNHKMKLRSNEVEQPIVPIYQLSNSKYLKDGWTKVRQPNFKITEKLFTFQTSMSHPHMNAFQKRIGISTSYYDNDQLAALFQEEGGSFIYYPNGEVAISITEGRVGPKLVVYSMSKVNKYGDFLPSQPMAIFDKLGNGVVYGYDGEIRLNYDQAEGAWYDANTPQPIHWVWKINEYLKQRRADLDGVAPDANDDIHISGISDKRKRSGRSLVRSNKTAKGQKSRKNKKGKNNRKSIAKTTRANSRPNSEEDSRQKKSIQKMEKKKSIKQGSIKKSRKSLRKTISAKRHAVKHKSSNPESSSLEEESKGRGVGRKTGLNRKGGNKGFKKRGTIRDLPPLRDPPLKPAPIVEVKPIALKITDHVSMRIMAQTHIHVDFSYFPKHFRLHVGMNIHPENLLRIDKVIDPQPVNNIVPCYFELMFKRSNSFYNLHTNLIQMRKAAFKKKKILLLKKCRLMGYKYDLIRRHRYSRGASMLLQI
ncbi:uncharacterized protein LOC106674291 [Cimex lectularius]|uniref:FAM194 C-terminal domain-containing protein n=1 Tax=Cimex lectularius TaxID=79782 RepID=A0A8I6SQX3_CIMLE|nr:uncharacterized protein LOC106674291 [Cimex lectularius]